MMLCFILNNIPNNIIVYAKIFMDEHVSKILQLSPLYLVVIAFKFFCQ